MSDYLIWSNEHGAWWGPGYSGYGQRIENAGRYSRLEAIEICSQAMPGRYGSAPLQEIPVRLEDLQVMLQRFASTYAGIDPEPPR